MATQVKLPELGENVESGQVVRILVAVGDHIEEGAPVVELETDKAAFEVPSTVAGTVLEIHVREGQDVAVGQLVLTIGEGGQVLEAETASASVAPDPSPAPAAAPEPTPVEPEPTLEAPVPPVVCSAPAATTPSRPGLRPDQLVPASPSVRRLARELGLDVDQLAGSGPAGRVSLEDVKAAARSALGSVAGGGAVATPPKTLSELPDFARWGPIERQSMTRVRQLTAEHMAHTWSVVPQVTQHDRADITDLEMMRKLAVKRRPSEPVKLTVTAIILGAVAKVLGEFPTVNASVDMARSEIVLKHYVHLGVAVDTERGLLVPVVRNANEKGVMQIAREMDDLAERARNKKLQLNEMQGATFTVTNLGGIAGTGFTPIVNHPEVAILGVARSRLDPVVRDGSIEPRLMLPLSLSYDHRLIDGADGARFLKRVVELLENPLEMSL